MNNRQCSLTIIKLASQNIHDFTKVITKYLFWNRIQEIKSLELYGIGTLLV